MSHDDLDLESFIANIEESAPQEELDDQQHRCQECDHVLDQVDGEFICPNCSAQATNILQLEETELHYDETGRAIVGQGVRTERRIRKGVDYGWAWSTDEAIVHILCEQLKALEKLCLIPKSFSIGTKKMWLKFWVENVAPYIKDEYNEEDFDEYKTCKGLRLRDIEVLVKVRDKVLIPKVNKPKDKKSPVYSKAGVKYFKTKDQDDEEDKEDDKDETRDDQDSEDQSEDEEPAQDRSLQITPDEDSDQELFETFKTGASLSNLGIGLTRTLGRSSVSVLTLNRTLAFIEATARCVNLVEPIFASDIVRACNQRIIPFFGAHKTLPEGMCLNFKDRTMFQKTRPPSPTQLTRAAALLLTRVYHNKLPALLPVPKLESILARFVEDMNLPSDFVRLVGCELDFTKFRQTLPVELHLRNKKIPYPPQYDRWAFAMLICYLKKNFNLDDKSVRKQSRKARRASLRENQDYFVLEDWARQMSIRLQLIFTYDPFIIFHPMTNINLLQPTPQVYSYIEATLSDRVLAKTRHKPLEVGDEESFRQEFSDFLRKELPQPRHIKIPKDEKTLETPIDFWHPIQDAFHRTQRFWICDFSEEQETRDLLFKDFSRNEVRPFKCKLWSILDNDENGGKGAGNKFKVRPEWPYCFKLLLSVGGYLCYCEPKELLQQVRLVDQFLYPHARVINKIHNLRKASSEAVETMTTPD